MIFICSIGLDGQNNNKPLKITNTRQFVETKSDPVTNEGEANIKLPPTSKYQA